MTAIAEPLNTRARPSAAQMARWAISDALVMTRRNLLVWLRVPAYIVFTVVQPIIFVLLFRYVFGGAIQAPGSGGYVSYLMPGIIAQTAAFATFATAIALAQEATKGVIDRFRAMPMARSAVLAGRLIAELDPDADRDPGDHRRRLRRRLSLSERGRRRYRDGAARRGVRDHRVRGFGIRGLAIKDEESVQAFGLIWIFPLTFVSSALSRSRPCRLAAGFANNQPVTLVINAMRSMALGGPNFPLNPALWESLVWLAGTLIVFVPLAVRSYRRVG